MAMEARDLVRAFLKSVCVETRAVAQLRFVEGLSQYHAADRLGITRGEIRVREQRLRRALAEHMHQAIPGSRLVVIGGGTHYTPVEYPAILQDEIGRLLERIPGWAAAPAARVAASR